MKEMAPLTLCFKCIKDEFLGVCLNDSFILQRRVPELFISNKNRDKKHSVSEH